MDSSILFTALGLPFGCLGLYVWYVETYTDTPLAQFWRAYGKTIAPRRVNEIASPLWMLCMISGSLAVFYKDRSATAHPIGYCWKYSFLPHSQHRLFIADSNSAPSGPTMAVAQAPRAY